MKQKLVAVLMAIILTFFCMPLTTFAAETVGYVITSPTSAVAIGGEFDVKIALSDYASMTAGIQGVQIDITNIDPSIIEVVSHSALAVDSGAASNKTSYSSAQKYVRYVYLNMSGTMDRSVTDLMTVRFKINSALTSNGSITLPVKLKIGTKTGSQTDSVTLEDSIVINYGESAPTETVSVDVTWGNSHLYLWGAIAICSFFIVILLLNKRRKRYDADKNNVFFVSETNSHALTPFMFYKHVTMLYSVM